MVDGPEGYLCRGTETASVARAVRTWKPGHSTSHWYLTPSCLVPVTPEVHKKLWSFLRDDNAEFTAYFSAMLGSTVDTNLRQSTELFRILALCLVRQWIHIYVCLQRPGMWFRQQKTAENPQLQFIDGRRFSCYGAQADSHGLAVQETMVFPRLQFLNEVIEVPGMQFVQVRRCVQRQVPSTAAVHQQGRLLPFRGAEAYPHDQAVQGTIEIPLLPYSRWLLSLFTGRADFPSWCRGGFPWSRLLVGPQLLPSCVWTRWLTPQVVRVPRVPSWREQLCSHSCTCSVTRYVQL